MLAIELGGSGGNCSDLPSLIKGHNGGKALRRAMTHTLLLDPESGSTPQASRANLAPEWADELERVMQRDREFFLQHPDRDYYVRPITQVEILEGQALGKEVDDQAQVLVGEVVPGSRVRMTVLDGLSPPVEEFRAMQQQLCQQMGAKATTLKDRIQHNQKLRPKAKGFGAKK